MWHCVCVCGRFQVFSTKSSPLAVSHVECQVGFMFLCILSMSIFGETCMFVCTSKRLGSTFSIPLWNFHNLEQSFFSLNTLEPYLMCSILLLSLMFTSHFLELCRYFGALIVLLVAVVIAFNLRHWSGLVKGTMKLVV